DRVVEKRRGERRLVHAEAGQDLRRAPRVVDELLARAAALALVRARGKLERAHEKFLVGVGLVALDLGDQLVDEIVMSLEYRHRLSVPLPFAKSLGRGSNQQAGNAVALRNSDARVQTTPTDEEAAPDRPRPPRGRRRRRSTPRGATPQQSRIKPRRVAPAPRPAAA